MTPYVRLQSVCEENGTNVTRFCKELKNSKGNLATWKKGNFSSTDLCAIHEKFGVSADYILGLSDEKTPLKKAASNIPIKRLNTLPFSDDELNIIMENAEGVKYFERIIAKLDIQQKIFVLSWLIGYAQSQGITVEF